MQNVSQGTQVLVLQSLESTFNKLFNAYTSMLEKGSNTILVQKRKQAVEVGLKSLKNTWYYVEDFSYNEEIVLASKETLQEILPSVEAQLLKSKMGSSQKTLLERRFIALELAIESLENQLT